MNLHPDIRFALSCYPIPQRTLLRPVLARLGINARQGRSHLTGDGFPFELSFTTADDDLRWTCELDSDATAPERLHRTRAVYGALGGEDCGDGTSPRRFGAWLGGRQPRDGTASYKLYLDPGPPPPGAPLPPDDLAGFHPSLRMIGLGPAAGRREYYYRFQSANTHLLRRLAATAGLAHRVRDLMGILRDTSGRTPEELLMRGSLGVSYAFAHDAAAPQMTLYFFARTLWGSDAAIRRGFLQLLDDAGRDIAPYATVTEPLRDHRRSCTWHGMAALTLTDTHHGWGIGLRPIADPTAQPYQRIDPCPTPLPC